MQIVKAEKLNQIHTKLISSMKRNERILEEALRKWFAFTLKQIQLDLTGGFQKKIIIKRKTIAEGNREHKNILRTLRDPVSSKLSLDNMNLILKPENIDRKKVNALKDAIKAKTKLKPLLVRRVGANKFQIWDGNHRYVAYKELYGAKHKVQVVMPAVDKADTSVVLTDWKYLQQQGEDILKPATLSIMQSGGGEAYKLFQVEGAFDILNPESVKAAQKFTADMVVQVNGETKKGIRTFITAGVKEGKSMPKIAKELRPLIGLTKNQTQSVINYKSLLSNKEKFPKLTTDDIERKTQRYADKTHRRRMQTIARTETARAQNIGYATGMDDLGVTQLEFSATIDEHTSSECMSLNGKKFKTSEAKGIIPVHPNCRCAMLPVVGNTPVCRMSKGLEKAACIPPDALHDEQIKDLVSRWDSAKSAGNQWNIAQKLKKFGYDIRTRKPVVTKPPIVKPPVIIPKPKPEVKPVTLRPSKLPNAVTVDEEYWHVTTKTAARSIQREGFKIVEAEVGGKIYGNGIYLGSYADTKALKFYRGFIRASKRQVMKVPVRVNELLEITVKPYQMLGKTCAQAARQAGLNAQYQTAKSRILAQNSKINRNLQKQPLMSRKLEEQWLRQQGFIEYPEGAALQEVLTKKGYNGLKIIAKEKFTVDVGGSQIVIYKPQLLAKKVLKPKPSAIAPKPAPTVPTPKPVMLEPPTKPKVTVAEQKLKTDPITSDSHLGGGTNVVRKITTDDFTAIFKPKAGEKKGITRAFKEGTAHNREAASYQVDKLLGLDITPTTVIREISGKIGSVQEFVKDAQVLKKLSAAIKPVGAEKMYFFDIVIGNADRHTGNAMYRAATKGRLSKMWAIDNAATFRNYKELVKGAVRLKTKTLTDSVYTYTSRHIAGKEIPKELLSKLKGFVKQEKAIRSQLSPLLEASELDGLFIRAKWLLKQKTFPKRDTVYKLGTYKNLDVIARFS